MNFKVTFFFRKPFQDYFSIERVFFTLRSYLDKQVETKNYFLRRHSKGLWKRVLSCFEVLPHQGNINHITGDIHFVSFLLPRKKTILTIHDLVPLKNSTGIRFLLLKYLWYEIPARRVKYITVISEFTKRELLQYINIDPVKIRVIPNPLPGTIKYAPKKPQSHQPVLLQIGTASNKNLEGLIKAVSGLELKLHIIGTLSNSQLRLLKKHNIDYLNFTNLSYDEVINCYKNADLLCFGSFYEGFGLPIIEAQAVGRPVITSKACSMPEVAGNGAVFIDPSNIEEYRKAVIEYLTNEELRKEKVAAGLINVKRFSLPEVGKQYLNLYHEMYADA